MEQKVIKKGSVRKAYLIGIIVIVVTVLMAVAVIYYSEYLRELRHYGYIGAFVFGFIAGSSIPVPLPYLVLTFTLGSVANPALVGVASGFGAGIGGTLVYLFGRGGHHLIFGLFSTKENQEVSPKVARFLDLARRRGDIVVFLMSAMLNPAFAPMAIAMGALRFRLWRFFLWCCAGNIVKSLVIAYCGYFGLGNLLDWLGR